jgi:Family of unknown function (DUF6516)
MAMAKADLIYHDKAHLEDGLIIEMKIWRLRTPSAERPHGLKYSLFFGKKGARIIGYDNESGKGDHRHYGKRQEPYRFTTVERLVGDFLDDVEKERGKR